MRLTNFDRYLLEQLADPTFVRRFNQAGQAWDAVVRIAKSQPAFSNGEKLS